MAVKHFAITYICIGKERGRTSLLVHVLELLVSCKGIDLVRIFYLYLFRVACCSGTQEWLNCFLNNFILINLIKSLVKFYCKGLRTPRQLLVLVSSLCRCAIRSTFWFRMMRMNSSSSRFSYEWYARLIIISTLWSMTEQYRLHHLQLQEASVSNIPLG